MVPEHPRGCLSLGWLGSRTGGRTASWSMECEAGKEERQYSVKCNRRPTKSIKAREDEFGMRLGDPEESP